MWNALDLKTLFLRRHYQHSGVDVKHSSSSNHILILSDCTFGTIAVLEVILVTSDISDFRLKITELN